MTERDNTMARGTVVTLVPRPPQPPALNVSERIEAMSWADQARRHGVRSVKIHAPEPGEDPALGGFVLIYEGDNIWATWGIAARRGSFEVWRPSSGSTVGWYRTIGEALRVVKDVA